MSVRDGAHMARDGMTKTNSTPASGPRYERTAQPWALNEALEHLAGAVLTLPALDLLVEVLALPPGTAVGGAGPARAAALAELAAHGYLAEVAA